MSNARQQQQQACETWLIDRCARAERFALDVARVVAAAETWRRKQQGYRYGRPVTHALINAVDALPSDWREIVREMGDDTGEYPLDEVTP